MQFKPFIYGLVDPADPGHVRYVGMAPVNARRPRLHSYEAKRLSSRPTHKINWIRKIQAEGREPSILMLEELEAGASREFLGFVEQIYIKVLRDLGHRLTNSTDGGEGASNPSPEVQKARSDRLRGNQYGLGRVHSEEEKDRRRQSLLKYRLDHPEPVVVTEAQRAQIAKTLTGYKHTPEARANMSASHIGRVVSDETRRRLSESLRGKEVPLERRVKISETLFGRKDTAETRAKKSAGIKAAKSTPEARAAASARQKEVWARRRGVI